MLMWSFPTCRLTAHLSSLPLQMAEAALQQEILEAKTAVKEAEAALKVADDDNKTLYVQLLLAKENALAQLRDKELIQQRASTGSYRFQFTVFMQHSVDPLEFFSLVCGLRFCCTLVCSNN